MKTRKEHRKMGKFSSKYATLVAVATFGGPLLVNGAVNADAINKPSNLSLSSVSASLSSGISTAQKKTVQTIITKGDQEINRRLTTLSTLTNKINSSSKLTPADKASLSAEVSSTSSGLTTLESQLNGDTTVVSAGLNASSIYTEYRVYALVAPKVNIIKVADDQQAVETKLSRLAQNLQTRITADQQAGKNVTTLQSELADMNSKIAAAQSISSNIENSVINLQPTDYNSNHQVLEGDNTQLATAASDNNAALNDAKQIASSLKS